MLYLEVRIQRATKDDAAEISQFCSSHAEFEGASFNAIGHVERLKHAMQDRVVIFIARDSVGNAIGYTSVTKEFSTWLGTDYLHLDCLYIKDDFRGQGLGRMLMEEVKDYAHAQGLNEIQWQTPVWNEDAALFYERLGASKKQKFRFSLAL